MIQSRELKSRNIKDLFFTLTHFHGCKTLIMMCLIYFITKMMSLLSILYKSLALKEEF